MEINHIKSGKYHLVELNGRLDALHNAKMEDFFNQLVENPDLDVIVDCEKLDFINSSGLRVFILSLKKLKGAGKKLLLCNLQKNIKDVFTYSGFNNLFEIDLDREGAMKKLE
jgi:anti-sigma B factor antagonist